VAALRACGVLVKRLPVCELHADLITYHRGMHRLLEVKDGSRPPSGQRLTPAEERDRVMFGVQVVNSVESALHVHGIAIEVPF
jgi:hypothetical protein